MINSILKINKNTVKNRKYLNCCRKIVYTIVYILCENLTLKPEKGNNIFEEAVEITADYYHVKKKIIKKLLKFTIFDQDIVYIIKDRNGDKFISRCKFLYLLYRTINKIIYELYLRNKNYKNIKLIDCIQIVGEWLSEYEKDAYKIVFNAIKTELRKRKSKYRNFYEKFLDKKFIESFDRISFQERVDKIFKKIDNI